GNFDVVGVEPNGGACSAQIRASFVNRTFQVSMLNRFGKVVHEIEVDDQTQLDKELFSFAGRSLIELTRFTPQKTLIIEDTNSFDKPTAVRMGDGGGVARHCHGVIIER